MLIVERASEATIERTNRLVNVTRLRSAGRIYVATLEPGAEVVHRLEEGDTALVYVVSGAASIEREDFAGGDAVRVTEQRELTIRAWQASTVVIIEEWAAPAIPVI